MQLKKITFQKFKTFEMLIISKLQNTESFLKIVKISIKKINFYFLPFSFFNFFSHE